MNRREFIGSAAATLAAGMAFAGLEPGAPFADHAVLQRGMEVPVWGTAVPGSRVKVEFAGASVDATVGTDGRWLAKLPPLEASKDGREMTITEEAGNRTISNRTIADILVGEVWFACGQSNMECPFWHEGWGYDTCACPDWGKRDRTWEIQLLGAPRADRQDESTFAFRRAVESAPNLVGVFAGHMHRWQFAQERGLLEVTATGAMFGDCLKVEVA
jgi:hypothetical protein